MNIFTKAINALRRRGVQSNLTEDFDMKTFNLKSNTQSGGVISHTEYITGNLKFALRLLLALLLSMKLMSVALAGQFPKGAFGKPYKNDIPSTYDNYISYDQLVKKLKSIESNCKGKV